MEQFARTLPPATIIACVTCDGWLGGQNEDDENCTSDRHSFPPNSRLQLTPTPAPSADKPGETVSTARLGGIGGTQMSH